jgi:hypothetical protein
MYASWGDRERLDKDAGNGIWKSLERRHRKENTKEEEDFSTRSNLSS